MEFIIVIVVVVLCWTGLAYLMNFSMLMGTKRFLNSPKLTDEKLLKSYKNLKNLPIIFIFYGGPIGFLLAHKKFIPEIKRLTEEKMKERNISF